MDKHKINELSSDLLEKQDKLKCDVAFQQKQMLESTAFLLHNIDHLKRLAATHPINDRYGLIVRYLIKNFTYIDRKLVHKILRRNGIFSLAILADIKFFLPVIFGIIIPNAFVIYINDVTNVFQLGFINFMLIAPFFIFLTYFIETLCKSNWINYRIDPEYKMRDVSTKIELDE